MSHRSRPILALFATAMAMSISPLLADHGEDEVLGTVSFPTSCKPELQPAFERAVALLHSFGYGVAQKAFADVAQSDPQCAMAEWGVAMTQYHPMWAAPTAPELATGKEAAERAAAIVASRAAGGKPVTDRERGFVAAINTFYADAATADHKTRSGRYRDAMGELAKSQPDDPEPTIFYALALLGTAPPNDATHAQQRKAVELLIPLVTRLPNHPGVAHYMIHGLDYPDLAAQGLDAARRYARIAPSSPHALHMPSHVFVRLGLWPEAIASNRDSAAAARAMGGGYGAPGAKDELHALDYLAYAYLQGGQDDEAAEVVKRTAALAEGNSEGAFQGAYAAAAVPARYALERERWAEAAALPLQFDEKSGSAIARDHAYVPAITYFARAIGASRSGDAAGAETALAGLAAAQQRLAKSPPPGPYDWAGYVESQRLAAAGWLAHARGRNDEAIKLLKQAAELEERVGKHPVTPGSVLPARELLSDLYLELAQPREALAEYELSLVAAPNRLRSLAGAAQAADLAGEADRGRTLRNLIAALTASGTRHPQEKLTAAKAGGG